MRHCRLFNTVSEFNEAYNGEQYEEPWVSVTEGDGNGRVDYNKPNSLAIPFTIEMLENGSILANLYYHPISYSLNGGAWVDLSQQDVLDVSLSSGDTISFKGNSGMSFSQTITGACNVYGNVMSLVCGDNFATATTIPQDARFETLLANTSVISAEDLLLPATTLTDYCYYQMFAGCTGLTAAPELPATTLTVGCYNFMFYGCTGLTAAPELPATTLAQDCYNSMFGDCTSLNSITCLATDISASDCTTEWVLSVASSGTFVKAASMSSWTTGVNGIPNGWTVIDASE